MPAIVHPMALCESESVGDATRIWAFAHVMKGAQVGSHCNIGEGAFVESGAVLGDRVTLKNQVLVWDGVRIGDDAFIGPGVVFTNDATPQPAHAGGREAVSRPDDLAADHHDRPRGQPRRRSRDLSRRDHRFFCHGRRRCSGHCATFLLIALWSATRLVPLAGSVHAGTGLTPTGCARPARRSVASRTNPSSGRPDLWSEQCPAFTEPASWSPEARDSSARTWWTCCAPSDRPRSWSSTTSSPRRTRPAGPPGSRKTWSFTAATCGRSRT